MDAGNNVTCRAEVDAGTGKSEGNGGEHPASAPSLARPRRASITMSGFIRSGPSLSGPSPSGPNPSGPSLSGQRRTKRKRKRNSCLRLNIRNSLRQCQAWAIDIRVKSEVMKLSKQKMQAEMESKEYFVCDKRVGMEVSDGGKRWFCNISRVFGNNSIFSEVIRYGTWALKIIPFQL